MNLSLIQHGHDPARLPSIEQVCRDRGVDRRQARRMRRKWARLKREYDDAERAREERGAHWRLMWDLHPDVMQAAQAAIHTLTVTHAYDEGEGYVEYEWVLDHGDCFIGEDCAVSMDLHESSLEDALCGYAWGDGQTYPYRTTYYLVAWASRYDVPGEPIEYDAGLYVSTVRSDLE